MVLIASVSDLCILFTFDIYNHYPSLFFMIVYLKVDILCFCDNGLMELGKHYANRKLYVSSLLSVTRNFVLFSGVSTLRGAT